MLAVCFHHFIAADHQLGSAAYKQRADPDVSERHYARYERYQVHCVAGCADIERRRAELIAIVIARLAA